LLFACYILNKIAWLALIPKCVCVMIAVGFNGLQNRNGRSLSL